MTDKVNFSDVGSIAQALKLQIRAGKVWDDLPPAAKEALDQIATSIATIVSGGEQHWDAIIRFAQVAKPDQTPPTAELERNIRAMVREIPRNSNET